MEIRGLALETSGRLGSIAITADGAIVAQDHFAHGLKHAAEMVPRIDALLKAVGWRPMDLDELYVSIGPGSFTGLRIGITLAKTLAFATGAKVIAVPSVEVLAANAPADALDVLIVLDAKREQIFAALLHRDLSGKSWQTVEPAHLDSLGSILLRSPRPVHLIGEGIPFHEKYFRKDEPGVIVTPPELWCAQAAAVASIGWRMGRQGKLIEAQELSPLYIRKPEAEEKYDLAAETRSGE